MRIAAATLFAAGKAGGLHGTMLLVTPLSLAILGCFVALDRWTDRYKLRSSADAWIARGYDSARSRYGWRVEELTSRRERKALARSLRSLSSHVAHPVGPSPVPIDVVALRPCLPFFEQLTERLEDASRPVSASGVLGVERLHRRRLEPALRGAGRHTPCPHRPSRPPGGAPLMFDVAAIAIGVACFAVIYVVLYALDRV